MIMLLLMSLQHGQPAAFGERVKELRLARRYSQRELAAKAGMDYTYLSKIENGRLEHTPSIRTIQGLALALGVDELELMDLANKVPAVFEGITRDREALRFFRHATETIRDPAEWRDLSAYLERSRRTRRAKRGRS
jgi:HTH-type transcriptional regulator, competence development regulator